MPEDENNEQSTVDAPAEGEGNQAGGELGKVLKIILPVGIAVLFGAAGHLASRIGTPSPSKAAETSELPSPQTQPSGRKDIYYDLEPIIVNLNEPQVARYLRVTLSLAIAGKDYEAAVKTIEKKTPEVKNWLIIYLSDLSLKDVRGAKNLNRIRRDVHDSLNERLWSGERPLITKVILKEWIVQ